MLPLVLTYHSLDMSGSVISTAPGLFRRQLELLVSRRVPVAPLERVAEGEPAVALTFDDGYVNFAEHAVPVLEEFQLPATVFVVSGRCGSVNEWDATKGIPRLRLLDWSAIRNLPPSLVALGGHSHTHRDLTRLPHDDLASELRGCRETIEQRTGRSARVLAYPFGRSNAAVRAAARSEFACAAGTELRYGMDNSDRFADSAGRFLLSSRPEPF